MSVSARQVCAIQALYPRIYLACHVKHVRRTASPANITATESMVYNPIFRLMARFVFGHYRTIDRYLADLGRHVNATAGS